VSVIDAGGISGAADRAVRDAKSRSSLAKLLRPANDLERSKRKDAITGYLFILPALLGFGIFFLTPALRAIWISFSDWNLLKKPNFIGLANYRELWHDPLFWNAVRVTFKYAFFNIPAQLVIGLFLASFMARKARSFVVRGLLLFPYLLSNVIAALVWAWIFDPSLGFGNQFLGWLHLPQFGFLGEQGAVLPSIAFINIWRHMGFTALLLFAGMQAIPGQVYEAARIDGASEWQMFRRLTLPLLRPVLAFVVITSLIGSFQIFDTIVVTSRGVPFESAKSMVWLIQDQAFAKLRMGYSSALSAVLFLFLIALGLLQLKLFRSDDSDVS
jgi:multiple sugar transport system permease protein